MSQEFRVQTEAERAWFNLPRTRYFDLGIEVIRQLRGELSQRELSRRLGYSFNQVGKWDSGATQIKFADFLQIAAAMGIPVEEKMRGFFYTFQSDFNEENCLRAMSGVLGLSMQEESPAVSRLQEWLKGSLKPDLWEVLELLDLRPSLLVGWLSEFVDCGKIEPIRPIYETFLSVIESLRRYPVSGLIVAAIQLQAYQDLERHDDFLLARHSACSVQELREALQYLLSAGAIGFDGKKFFNHPVQYGFSGLQSSGLRGMTKFAIDLASKRYSLTPAKVDPNTNVGQSAFRSVALSREGSFRARELILKFHSEMAELVEQDKGQKCNVQVIMALSFPSTFGADE